MSASFSRIWEKTKDRWLMASAILFSLLFMALDQSPPLVMVKRETGQVMGMLQKGMSWLPGLVRLRTTHRELLVELGRVSLERDKYRETLLQNERLRNLLGFMEQKRFDCIPAEVIGRGTVGIAGTVHLNIGWRQGCHKNMALVTEKGVVGKIVSVNAFSSVGLLLTDPNCRVSGKVQRTRVLGIVRWLYGDVCQLEGVPLKSDVRIGNVIVTSGYSEIYPPGLAVGRVIDVSPDEEGLFLKIRLKTAVDLGTLEEVLVLKNDTPLLGQ